MPPAAPIASKTPNAMSAILTQYINSVHQRLSSRMGWGRERAWRMVWEDLRFSSPVSSLMVVVLLVGQCNCAISQFTSL